MREVGSRECNDNERWRVGICLNFGVLCKERGILLQSVVISLID
jgi:hypothetical protein